MPDEYGIWLAPPVLLLPIRVLVWLWARLLVVLLSRWSPLTPPLTRMSALHTAGLFADIHDFDPTSGWGDDDEVTAAMPVCGDAEVTTTATTDAVSASVAGAARAVEPLLARQRCGNRAHRGRDDLFADVDDFDPTWSGVVVMRPQQRGRV